MNRPTIVWYAAMAVQAKVEALLEGRISAVLKHRGHVHTVAPESRFPNYSARGHFCYLLFCEELTHAEIAEVLGELDGVADEGSDAWRTAREQARRAVQQRIHRFREANPEA